MPDEDQTDTVTWRDGTPVSTLFDDPYFSLVGGLAETRHVFLAGNDLPGRFTDGFHIAELGFGTGLNLVASVLAWRQTGIKGRFRFTSFEAHPMPASDMAAALAAFPEAQAAAGPLLAAWRDGRRSFDFGPADVTVNTGDAGTTLTRWDGIADAWFLDGFAPAKNPGLWSESILREVARHTAPGGSFATYTAAGHVRRALTAAGFVVERIPGYGRKRHMSRGVLEGAE